MSVFVYLSITVNSKINNILSIIRLAKNWYDVVLFRIGIRKTLTIKFRNGKSVCFKSRKEYFDFWESEFGRDELSKLTEKRHYNYKIKGIKIKSNSVELNYQNKKLYFYYDTNKQLNNTIILINANFINEQLKRLDVRDKDIVDVGANIGDTAIYFALKGAKHVYAFEPYPYSYNIAKKNIKLNHLENKITLLNEGCGRSGFVTIREDYENSNSADLKNFKKGKKIKIESLDEIVKRFNLKHSALKVDCEGCEYDLILNASDEALNAFDQIIIEYHYGYKNLIEKLKKSGFIIKVLTYGYPSIILLIKSDLAMK